MNIPGRDSLELQITRENNSFTITRTYTVNFMVSIFKEKVTKLFGWVVRVQFLIREPSFFSRPSIIRLSMEGGS